MESSPSFPGDSGKEFLGENLLFTVIIAIVVVTVVNSENLSCVEKADMPMGYQTGHASSMLFIEMCDSV